MTFEEVLDQAIAMLQRRGRLTYSALKRQFALDDACLADLTEELIEGQRVAVDDGGKVLIWVGDTPVASPAVSAPLPPAAPAPQPLSYTPTHLAEKILTARRALEGERKQVTVLFADIKDSTEIIRDLDPEAAQQLLDPAIHIMMRAVHRFEGTVNQVLGDGIMALFGAPIAHEDHALRACYAALAMQAAMRDYTEEVRRTHGIPLQIRVGLNAGEVVVRTIGNDLHMDYSAVGLTTHLAARMEQLATPGSILLTAATLRLVEGYVRANVLGALPVKGMTDPVEVSELTGASAIRRRLQASVARGLTRFVGREAELALLHQALERASAGQGQVVAAVGDAGVGKSRLVYEFLQSRRTPGWRVLESASVSYGKATPYFPVIDLLKRYGRLDEGDDLRTVRAKVTGQVLTLDEALQDTIPALLSLLEALPDDSPFLRLDPPQRRQRTLDALTRVLLRESQAQPLLLVFEDLHWIDAATQALLDRLVERLPTAAILLLVNYRPEYQQGWGSKTYYTELRLDPLPPASADTLLQDLLGDDASLASLKSLLITRTQGNPFFLEESVRTLVETGVLEGARGAYRLGQAVAQFQVPATVQAMLAARIDRLPAQDKQLLQTAAVIGTDVPLGLLQAIAEVPEAELHRGLTHLQAAEFVYETQLFPEHVYTFKHALTHEVAYGSLLQERRRLLHGRIVEALEALLPEWRSEQVESLAQHALRGEVWDKALRYCHQAGAKAMARSACREAVVCFEQALQALEQLPKEHEFLAQAVDLRLDLRNAHLGLGELARVFRHLQDAHRLAQSLHEPHRLGWVYTGLAQHFNLIAEYARALEAGQQALALGTAHADIGIQTTAFNYMAVTAFWQGDYARAIEPLRRAVALLNGDERYERFGQASLPAVLSRTMLASCLAEMGKFAEACAVGEEGLRIAETVKHPTSLVHAYRELGVSHVRQGNLSQACARLEQALGICQEVGLPLYIPVIAPYLGLAYGLSGRIEEAIGLLEEAMQQADAMGQNSMRSLQLATLSEVHLQAGDLATASDLAHQALQVAQTYKEPGRQAYALRLLGTLGRHRDAADAAEVHYQQALTLAEALGMRPLQAHCHYGLGTLYRTMGRGEQARTALATAIALYRALAMPFWLPQAEATLSQVD